MKEKLVMLRGLTREKRHWGDFPSQLKNRLDLEEVILLDLPGFGDFHKERSPSHIDEIADFVFDKLQEHPSYNTNTSYHLLGLSLGGMVVLDLASRSYNCFKSYIVLNTSQTYKTPFYKRFNIKHLPKLLYAYLIAGIEKREELVLKATTHSAFNPEVAKRWAKYYREKPYSTLSVVNQLLAGSRFSVADKVIDLKAQKGLILTSYADDLVSYKSSKILSEITGWSIDYNAKAGHDFSYDESEWLIERISDFLNVD